MSELVAVVLGVIAGVAGIALYLRTLRLRAERETRAQIETERGRVADEIRTRDAEIATRAALEHAAVAEESERSRGLTPSDRLERIRARNRK